MYKLSRFESKQGIPNQGQVEEWAENYFFSLLNILNAFFVHVEVKEAAARMEAIPFTELVKEELEGETELIINLAVEKVQELAKIEMEFLTAYIE